MGFDLYCGCCGKWATDSHLTAKQRHMKNVLYWAESVSDYDKVKQAVAYFTWPAAIAELEGMIGICGPDIREHYEQCRNAHAASLDLPEPFPAMPASAAPHPEGLPPLQVPLAYRVGELERRLDELEAVVLEHRGSAAASASDSGQDSWTQVSLAGPEVATAGQAVEPALARVESLVET